MGKDRVGLRDRHGPGRCGRGSRRHRRGSRRRAPGGRADLGARHSAPASEPGRYPPHRQGVDEVILGRVVGTIVATRKDPRLEGQKLLIVRPVTPEGAEESGYLVAVDTVQAGSKELVLVVSGSSARM